MNSRNFNDSLTADVPAVVDISTEQSCNPDEIRYKTLIKNASVGLYRTTSDGRILYANPYLVRMMGFDSQEQMQELNLETAGFNEEGEREKFKQLLNKTGQIDSRESIWIKRDGGKFYVVESARIVEERPDGVQIYEGVAIDITEKKLAELEILKSERKYRELFEGITDGIIKLDRQDRFIEANTAFLDMQGYSRQELFRLRRRDITPDRYRETEEAILRDQVLVRGFSDPYETELMAKSGTLIPFELITYAVFDCSGNPDGTWTITRNITRRRQNRKVLEESRAKLLETQHIANLGNWVWDMPSGKIELSAIGRRIFGIDQDRTLSIRDMLEFMHEEYVEDFATKIKQATGGKLTGFYECRIVRPDKTEKYLQFRHIVSASDEGRPIRLTGTILDVTEIKRYQIELERKQKCQEESLKQEKIISEIAFRLNRVGSFRKEINSLLLETARIIEVQKICFLKVENDLEKLGLLYCSKTGANEKKCGCALANKLRSIAGYSETFSTKKPLILNDLDSCSDETRNCLKLHHIHSFVALPISLADKVRGILVFSQGNNFEWSEDNIRFLQTLANVISSAWGRDTHYHARLEAERKNRESARLLAQSARLNSLGVMAGGIAHEINQPLNAIRLTADYFSALADKGVFSIPEKYLNRLQKISDHVCRIDIIIQKMRHLWAPVSNAGKESFDINAALKRATAMVLEQFSPDELHVEFILAPDSVNFYGNPFDLDQIVINLINNSLEALEEMPPDERKITIRSAIEDNSLRLRFEDNGSGFKIDDSYRLFDPFYSTKINNPGIGLGLAIVKNIVENNGGTIKAFNREPNGAVIEIILPLNA